MLNALTNADQARVSRIAALTLCAACAVVCVWALAKLLWLAVPQSEDAAMVRATVPAASAAPQASIAKWHLFGNPQNPALARVNANAPATSLKLTLRGTLALNDPKQGLAMIADERGGERSYRVGDDVSENTKLAEVYTDHVVLTHENVAESLQLPKLEDHVPAADTASARTASSAVSSGKATSIPPGYTPPQMATGAVDWNKAQKNLQIDPSKIAQQVHIEPVFENGKIAGARLSGGGDVAALMNKAGLNSSDIVTSINGKSLTSLSDPQSFVDNLKNSTSLQVTVLRDGKPATLTVSLR